MAKNEYLVQMIGDLETSLIEKKIKDFTNRKTKVPISFDLRGLGESEMDKYEQALAKSATKQGDRLSKLDEQMMRNAEKEGERIDKLSEKEKKRIEELEAKDKERSDKKIAQAQLYADKFLERSKTLEQTPQVRQAVGVAQQIKLETDPTKIAELNRQLTVLDAGIRQSGHSAWSWGEQMKVAAQRAMEWASVTTVLYAAFNQVKEGIQYIKDLDKEMTNIQIATGLTSQQTNQLSKEYNQMAKELSVSTLEVARGATTWLKQGKSVEEANILIRDTTMLAKLGMVDTAEASEYLTSTLNGFQLEAKDATGIIDKLVAVDNAAATSVSELSVALSRSANIARISGVSFENLVSYIGTVSSVTRRSAESVGESFKTLFSRMADIQRGGLDEEGMNINQVERSLKRVNITLRDSENSFREFDDVLDDVANGWKDYDDITKADIRY